MLARTASEGNMSYWLGVIADDTALGKATKFEVRDERF